MAYLSPDNISSKIFEKLPNLEEGKHIKAINLLRKYSMINQGSSTDSSNIYRLVQEVRLIQLKNAKESEEIREETVLADMLKIFENEQSINVFSSAKRKVPTILTCLCASQYDGFTKQIKRIIPALDKIDVYHEQSLTQSILELVVESGDNGLVIKSLKSVPSVWEEQKHQILEKILKGREEIKSSTIKVLINNGLEIKSKLNDVLELEDSKKESFLKAMKSCKQFNKEEKFLCLEKTIDEPIGKRNQELFNFLMGKEFLDVDLIQEKFIELLKGNNIQDPSRLIKLVENSVVEQELQSDLIYKMLNETIESKKENIFNYLQKKHPKCVVKILEEAIGQKDEEVLNFLEKGYKKFNEYIPKMFDKAIYEYLSDQAEDNRKLDEILYMYSTSSIRKAVIKNWLKEREENYRPFPIEYQQFKEDVQHCKSLLQDTRQCWQTTTELLDTDLECLYSQMFFLRHNQELISDAMEKDTSSRTREVFISHDLDCGPNLIDDLSDAMKEGTSNKTRETSISSVRQPTPMGRDARSTPSSAMEVVDVRQSHIRSGQVYSNG